MKRWNPVLFAGGLTAVLSILLIAGCSSTGGAGAKSNDHGTMQGMMCPGCETVWIAEPTRSGPRHVTTLSRSPQATCAECDLAARSYLDKGQMVQHQCPMCKVTPVPIRTQDGSQPRPG